MVGNIASALWARPFANSTPPSMEPAPNAGTSVTPVIAKVAFRAATLP